MDFCRISTSLSMQKRMPVMGFMLEIRTFEFYIGGYMEDRVEL